MKIKSMKLENNKILGNLNLDFTDVNGQIVNSIIIAGENGTGKSTILNIIYDFANFQLVNTASDEKREFVIQFSNKEMYSLRNEEGLKPYLYEEVLNSEFTFRFDYSIQNNWNQIKVLFKKLNGEEATISSSLFTSGSIRKVMRVLFSDVEINFNANNINTVTSKTLDEDINTSIKSEPTLATEISQLLVDIQAIDAEEFYQWGKENVGKEVDGKIMDTRMRRFKDAFEFMFSEKKYKGVSTDKTGKKVIFENYGKEVSLDKFSSGEKQIVFRGSFLLKDRNSNIGSVVLIDEPEISLHPTWQLKVLDYYKRLFTDESGNQTSQMFFVTHSPFIIHNNSRNNDKVIVLKKDERGSTYQLNKGTYFGWTDSEIVKEAFNFNSFKTIIDSKEKNLVITEGKTDWKHLKRALKKLREEGKMLEEDFEFLEYEDEINMGDKELISLCEQISKLNDSKKIICIFDRDVPETLKKVCQEDSNYKDWGRNVYSFAIPVPEHRLATPNISIEHYYTDEEIKTEDEHNRRLYIGKEFSRKSGLHVSKSKFCLKKDKCGDNSIKILDSEIFLNENENDNIALSKNQFTEYIFNEIGLYGQISYSSFESIFLIIREILDK